MPLVAIDLDPKLWEGGSETRRAEWRLAVQELLEDHSLALPGGQLRLEIAKNRTATRFRLVDGGGAPAAPSLLVPTESLAPHLDEYVTICRTMVASEGGTASAPLEALDMAKKLAHDAAAKTLAGFLAPLAPDHATCRRVFTLLLTIHVDTTTLASYHLGHGPRR